MSTVLQLLLLSFHTSDLLYTFFGLKTLRNNIDWIKSWTLHTSSSFTDLKSKGN